MPSDADVREAALAFLQALTEEGPDAHDTLLAYLAEGFGGLGTGPDDYYPDRDAFCASIRREKAQMPYPASYEELWTDARRIRPDLGVAVGQFRATIHAEPAPHVVEPRFTFVLERQGDRWLLLHSHFSVEDAILDPGDTFADALERRNRELEREVARRTAELLQSLAELRTAQARLVQQEKMASLGMLTAGVAHEIKNPLNFVTNFAALTRETVDDLAEEVTRAMARPVEADPEDVHALLDDLRAQAERIEAHGRRADSIVRAMLDHARGDSGERQVTDLNALVEEYADLAWHGARARQIGFAVELEKNLGPAVGTVELVPQEIGRVVLNLIGNAFDALTAEGAESIVPRVVVTTQRTDGRVEVRVADNGPGVPETLRAKVFEPFFTTKPTGQGIGLGLSLSYDIVTQGHGGTLAVEPTPGGGATFVMTLPGVGAEAQGHA